MAFIRINRKLFEHSFWKENREYSRAEAWIDLIQLVSFTPDNKRMIDGVLIKWGRGQYPVSIRFMSQRWNWSTHKVRIFIDLLKAERQVATSTAGKTTILTLCNYDIYNPSSQGDVQGDVQGDGKVTAQSIRREEDKEVLKEKNKKENFSFQENGKDWREQYNKFLNKEPEPEDLSFMEPKENPEGF